MKIKYEVWREEDRDDTSRDENDYLYFLKASADNFCKLASGELTIHGIVESRVSPEYKRKIVGSILHNLRRSRWIGVSENDLVFVATAKHVFVYRLDAALYNNLLTAEQGEILKKDEEEAGE